MPSNDGSIRRAWKSRNWGLDTKRIRYGAGNNREQRGERAVLQWMLAIHIGNQMWATEETGTNPLDWMPCSGELRTIS